MRQIRGGLLVALALLLLTGCNARDNKADAEVKYATVRDHFLGQHGYSFYGQTKLVTGSTTNSNLVNYSGVVQGKDVYLDVRLSYPEGKRVTTMSILSRGPELFARVNNGKGWIPVHGQDFSIRQEFENWNPIQNVQQMDQMRAKVLPLRDRDTDDNLEGVRVLLDSGKLKSWLRDQIHRQQSMSTESVHMPKMKMALSLSEHPHRLGKAQIQSVQETNSLENMIDNMELEAEYTLFYDKVKMLPTKMTMAIRSQYVYGNQNVVEHSEIETFFRDYGRSARLPTP